MRILCVLVVCCSVALTGCDSARKPGQEVRGTVLLDGKPLESGSVVLVPIQGTRGPKCYALVKDGEFHIAAAEGPFPGVYRVEVYSAAQLQVPMEGVEESPAATSPGPPPVALQFNKQSQLTVEVAADAPVELTLEVQSAAAP